MKTKEANRCQNRMFRGLGESRRQVVSTVANAATCDRVVWILGCRRGGDVDPACRASQDPSRKGTLGKKPRGPRNNAKYNTATAEKASAGEKEVADAFRKARRIVAWSIVSSSLWRMRTVTDCDSGG